MIQDSTKLTVRIKRALPSLIDKCWALKFLKEVKWLSLNPKGSNSSMNLILNAILFAVMIKTTILMLWILAHRSKASKIESAHFKKWIKWTKNTWNQSINIAMEILWRSHLLKVQETNQAFIAESTTKRATSSLTPTAWVRLVTITMAVLVEMEMVFRVKTVIHLKFKMQLINSRSVKNWFKCNKCKTFNNSFNHLKFFNKTYNNSSYRISSNSNFHRLNS